MSWKHIFAKKDLEMLLAEMAGEHRLHRVLGPVALTCLGVGCIIGAGIFVMTGRAAAQDAGPAVIISFAIAALGCALAALCYAEFAAMAPVAGSAYTYAYTTLGEIFAWVIGWDLILEYAMGCATVASAWSGYLNEFLLAISHNKLQIPLQLLSDPFTPVEGLSGHAWFNLPSLIIMVLVTTVLVIGIRESARTNATLVIIKLAVVLFVVIVGWAYVEPSNWTTIPYYERALSEEREIPTFVEKYQADPLAIDIDELTRQSIATYRVAWTQHEAQQLHDKGQLSADGAAAMIASVKEEVSDDLPQTQTDRSVIDGLSPTIGNLFRGRSAEKVSSAEEKQIANIVGEYLAEHPQPPLTKATSRDLLNKQVRATYRLEWIRREAARLQNAGRLSADEADAMTNHINQEVKDDVPRDDEAGRAVARLLPQVHRTAKHKAVESWGILGLVGLNKWLLPIDDATRSPFMPYGLSGIMLGAAIVFFAYIGFDSISTHAEEARKPQRDVPIGILFSLILCTVLYMAVAAVITGMMPYTDIDIRAPIAVAFREKAAAVHSPVLGRWATGLIALGGLAGMTSVLLVLFLSQARIFMAMARDGLLPAVFGTVHPRFRTPHIATMVTGVVICLVAALTPIRKLEEMVNVGTLMAFVIVCAAVLILRIQRPNVTRPFRCPIIWLVAPLGMLVNLTLMLFLPIDTWFRLVIWLLIGFVIYFGYSRRHSHLVKHLMHEIQAPRDESADADDRVAPSSR